MAEREVKIIEALSQHLDQRYEARRGTPRIVSSSLVSVDQRFPAPVHGESVRMAKEANAETRQKPAGAA